MDNYLYQIQNEKSGRRVIYKGFDQYEWSNGNGEDGTLLKEDQVDFILKLVGWPDNEICIVRYEKRYFGNWPITVKKDRERIVDLLELDI